MSAEPELPVFGDRMLLRLDEKRDGPFSTRRKPLPHIVAMAFTIAGTANDGPFKPHDLRVSTRHPRSTIRGRSCFVTRADLIE